jgi:hypothetical protein
MTRQHFYALLGFLFVAAWIAFNFGYAILCLLGAAAFYFASGFLQGGIDLGELQSRFQGVTGGRAGSPSMRTRVR